MIKNPYTIDIPYQLTEPEVQLDPVSVPVDPNRPHPMEYLVDQVSWEDEEALELLMRGAVILKHKFPQASFASCLETSIIWYAG